MALPKPEPGLVISYAYLWRYEATKGLADSRKDRPAAIVAAVTDAAGDTVVYVAPITHVDPGDERAILLTPSVKKRLGLDAAPSWIVTSELNRFVWPGYDLRPISRDRPDVFSWGYLPVDVFARLKQAIAEQAARRGARIVDRD